MAPPCLPHRPPSFHSPPPLTVDFSQRIAGVLLPVSALPGEHPCGGLGRDARRFLHALAETGATVWQVLPLGPTRAAEGHSPDSARCTFSLATDLVTDGDLEDFIQRPAAEDPTPSPADSCLLYTSDAADE